MTIQNKKKRSQAGFTLVEVMVTMVIIGLMTAGVVVTVLPKLKSARADKAVIDISRLGQALEYYNLENNTYPEELAALVAQNSTQEEGYIKKLPDDPWGNPYLYVFPGENGAFDIWSFGADGVEGGEGENADITSWTQ